MAPDSQQGLLEALYKDYLDGKTGAQGGEKAHHLLHTGYKQVDVYKFAE